MRALFACSRPIQRAGVRPVAVLFPSLRVFHEHLTCHPAGIQFIYYYRQQHYRQQPGRRIAAGLPTARSPCSRAACFILSACSRSRWSSTAVQCHARRRRPGAPSNCRATIFWIVRENLVAVPTQSRVRPTRFPLPQGAAARCESRKDGAPIQAWP
jgi:hypothetical protein